MTDSYIEIANNIPVSTMPRSSIQESDLSSSPNIDPSLHIVSIDRGDKIGSGGFSNVYKIYVHSMDNDQKIKSKIAAMKFISCSQNSGLESLMESHIMRYIHHPHINRAWGVQSDKLGNITIIQSLALGDASSIIRKKFNKLNPKTLKKWLWQIVTAVAKLHSRGILHGDIKAGNILVFSDKGENIKIPPVNVNGRTEFYELLSEMHTKLNDFSLSRLISNPLEGTSDVPRHISYTSTHRAIEVWKGMNYSFPADIWALGCTCYEIAYGTLLFQDQSHIQRNTEMESNLQAFEDWASRNITPNSIGNNEVNFSQKKYSKSIGSPRRDESDKLVSLPVPGQTFINSIHLPTLPIPISKNKPPRYELSRSAPMVSSGIPVFSLYKKCKMSPEWEDEENEVLNDLILGMLHINANERLTIWEIIEHEYFDDIRSIQSPFPKEEINLEIKDSKIVPVEIESKLIDNKYMNSPMYSATEYPKENTCPKVMSKRVTSPTSTYTEGKDHPDDLLPLPDERQYPTVTYTFDGVSQSVIDEATSMTTNYTVMQLGVSLYQRARESSVSSHIIRPSLKGCIIVANKLLYRGPPVNFGLVGGKYLQDEINLCLCLNYKMLPHSSDRKTPKT